jgi:hypothetical protein
VKNALYPHCTDALWNGSLVVLSLLALALVVVVDTNEENIIVIHYQIRCNQTRSPPNSKLFASIRPTSNIKHHDN